MRPPSRFGAFKLAALWADRAGPLGRTAAHEIDELATMAALIKWLNRWLPMIMLVFVPVIQELSASILLFSSSSITLAVAVYNLYETGYIEPVAALAIINMLIIGAAIWLAYLLGGRSIASRNEPAPVHT